MYNKTMLYLESMFFRVAAACLFLSSFLAEQGRAYTLDEENKPTNIAERLERLEMELKSQKQETENLKSTVQSLDNHVKTLTQFNEEQMVRNKDLETELDMMRVGNEQGYIPISENATTEERAKLGVQQVKKKFRQQRLLLDDMDASPVGFTAYLDHNTPNLGINQIIVFNRVLFNEGSAYNNSSGIFVCPADGVYMFYFTVSNSAGHQIVAKLVVNGVNYVDAIADSDGGNQYTEAQGSNMAILSLSKGSHVSIENYRWGQQQADGAPTNRFSSFSGIRLY